MARKMQNPPSPQRSTRIDERLPHPETLQELRVGRGVDFLSVGVYVKYAFNRCLEFRFESRLDFLMELDVFG